MKTSHLVLSLVSLSLTAIIGRADTANNQNEIVQLPAFTVEAPRQTAAERQIASNLAELRAAARVPLAVKAEVPLVANKVEASHDTAKPAPVLVVAQS